MADTFLLEVATPEKLLLHEKVLEALLSEMGSGELSYTMGGQKNSIMVGGGWVEVVDYHVRVLTSVVQALK